MNNRTDTTFSGTLGTSGLGERVETYTTPKMWVIINGSNVSLTLALHQMHYMSKI